MFRGIENYSEPGAPEVLVPNSVIKRYGEPYVQSNSLGQLFEEEFKLPPGDVKLKFYKGSELGEIPAPFDVWRYGYRTPYSNTLHIPVWDMHGGVTPMSKVIALGLTFSKKRSQQLGHRLLATEITAGSGTALGIGLAANSIPLTIAGMLGLGVVGTGKASSTNPSNLQGMQPSEMLSLRKTHDKDIVFSRQSRLNYRT